RGAWEGIVKLRTRTVWLMIAGLWAVGGVLWLVGRNTDKPAADAFSTPAPSTCTAVAPAAVASSPAAAVSSAATRVVDNPAFDLTGSGSDCVMTYGSRPDGRTVTIITVNQPGNIITHVSDRAGNINRHDE